MQWMEVIQIQAGVEGGRPAMQVLVEILGEVQGAAGLATTKLLKHAQYPGDIAAVLVWDNDRVPVRTREGLLLADIMGRHGAVAHAVWEIVS